MVRRCQTRHLSCVAGRDLDKFAGSCPYRDFQKPASRKGKQSKAVLLGRGFKPIFFDENRKLTEGGNLTMLKSLRLDREDFLAIIKLSRIDTLVSIEHFLLY
ncbi:MAG: hypothetical protein DWQ51_04030 [Microcystis wesenbergii TW10]|uniref:Uncharacterized protein n=1 Tax=Microcystis wesenbergii TW10 TaxID=2060474 RepID=A0A3E0M8K1_9CHRO|nr:MAG: hypothetical protein DWQ51_04030 [Microcystis wesenbergii TW10]